MAAGNGGSLMSFLSKVPGALEKPGLKPDPLYELTSCLLEIGQVASLV